MDILEKYKLDIKECILVKKLPTSSDVFLLELVNDKNDDLYINENGKLKLIASKPWSFSILQLFLKKYRKNPELLPKNLKNEFEDYLSSNYL